MENAQAKLVDYFRRCYRADNYGIAISNVSRLPATRYFEISECDDLACGMFPRIPMIYPQIDSLNDQVEKYKKERLLVYACFFVTGQVETNSGFSSIRRVNSPLVYFPASLFKDPDYYLKIDTDDLHINRSLLRQLLRPEFDSVVLESFPELKWPISNHQISSLTAWIREYTTIQDPEELGRWPKFSPDIPDGDELKLKCSCAVILAERSKGSRGILYELKALMNFSTLSPPLSQLLGGNVVPAMPQKSDPDLIPGSLSSPQMTALKNAATETLSMVSGPPGTGKSYTIAAIAIDRMLKGESVLVVSRSDQAINVVGQKLIEDFNLGQGYVHMTDANFLKSVKDYLETLLSQGVEINADVGAIHKNLKNTQRELKQLSRTFDRKLALTRWLSTKQAFAAQRKGVLSVLVKFITVLEGWVNPAGLWQYPKQINKLQLEADKLGARFINASREKSLSDLLESRREEISKFLQALRARSSKTLEERFSQTNISDVLKAFPIWLVNVNDLDRVLPLEEGMFDLVLFDEATQCDIASALPALQRAKRAVIVGDKKQLKHVSFISGVEEQEIYRFCGLDPIKQQQFSYRDQSVLDLSSDMIQSQSAICMLDEYYRGKVDLIAFSNKHFYDNRLKVMRNRPGEIVTAALNFVKLEGQRSKSGRNKGEADQVITKIKSHINEYGLAILKPSVGVLSPYREQAVYLEKEVRNAFTDKEIEDFKIRVDTPYGFQGEERDLMLLSMAVDPRANRAAAYLNKNDMFNVAITRAKESMLVYHSIDAKDLTRGNLLRRYLEHDHLETVNDNAGQTRCDFAREFSSELLKAGYQCWVGFNIAGVEIDVVCQKDDTIIGIDLIGFPGDFQDYYDVNTYKTLCRAGLDVLPLAHSTWVQNREHCIGLVDQYFA